MAKDDFVDVRIHIDEAQALSTAIARIVGLRALHSSVVKDIDLDLVMSGMFKILNADKSDRLWKRMRHDGIEGAKFLFEFLNGGHVDKSHT